MSVYYQDESVTLYHGLAEDVLATLADQSVDCVITDPPFDARTHSMARNPDAAGAPAGGRILTGSKAKFASFTHEEQVATFTDLARVTRRWVVASLSTDTAFRFELQPPPGLRTLRIGAWIKTNPMPIFSGDRPAMGWEALAYLHRDDVKPTWNGGGKAANYVLPSVQGSGHPTAKPLAMVTDWVRLFSNLGDLILDPYAGSGTTLRAAKDEGRRAIGVEVEERYCELIAGRLAQDVLDFGESA